MCSVYHRREKKTVYHDSLNIIDLLFIVIRECKLSFLLIILVGVLMVQPPRSPVLL